jgi:hypothetical protein
VLGREGAEVFDVDGGHVEGDGFLFREKHCRNKKVEKRDVSWVEKKLNIQSEMKKKKKKSEEPSSSLFLYLKKAR